MQSFQTAAFCFAACLAFGSVSFAKEHLLLTAFEPFGGHAVNNSERTAQKVLAFLNAQEIDVTFCLLPVEYDRAAEVMKKCFSEASVRPTRVLSLGEIGGCSLRVESMAENLDDESTADSAGVIRKQHVIETGGPTHSGFTWPMFDMYCRAPESDRKFSTPSNSLSNYVCNNTAYLGSRYFKKLSVPYTFIHVPAYESCGDSGDPFWLGMAIARMIENSLLFDPAACPDCLPIPTDSKKLKSLSQRFKNQGNTCYADFFKAIR